MADETINVVLTDNGSIDQVTALLEVFGLNAEQAAARASSAFVNTSSSATVAETSVKAFGAAASAGFDSTGKFADALDKLTTAEGKSATSGENLNRIIQLLRVAQQQSLQAAVDAARGTTQLADAQGSAGASADNLSRLQQNLAQRATEQAAAQAALAAKVTTVREAQTQLAQSTATVASAFTATTSAQSTASATVATLTEREEQLVVTLQRLGIDGATALQKVTSGYVNLSESGEVAITSVRAMGAAANAGYSNVNLLGEALDKLTVAEGVAATSATRLIALEASLANAAEQGTFATSAQAAAQEKLATSFSARAAAATAAIAQDAAVASGAERVASAAGTAGNALAAEQRALTATAAAEQAAAEQAGSLSARLATLSALVVKGVQDHSSFSGAIHNVGTAFEKLTSDLGPLALALTTYLSLSSLVEASDAFSHIAGELNAVSGSTAAAQSNYTKLLNVSNQTQTSFENNVKVFSGLTAALKDTGVTADQTIKAVDGFGVAFKIAGASSSEASRFLKEFQESVETTDGSTKRFTQTMQRDVPGAYALFKAAAADLNIKLDNQGAASDKAALKTQELNDKISNLKNGTTSVSNESAKYSAEISKQQAVTANLTAAIANGTGSYTANAAALTNSVAKTTELVNAQKANSDAYSVQQGKALQVAEATKQISDETTRLTAAQQIQIAGHIADLYSSQAAAMSTVSGALQVLKNNFIDFIGTNDKANAGVSVLKAGILTLANNLGTVIPVAVAFGAALVTIKAAQIAADIVKLTSAIALGIVPLAPYIVAIGGLAAAAYIGATAMAALLNAFRPANDQINVNTVITQKFNDITTTLGSVVAGATDKIVAQTAQSKVLADLQAKLTGTSNALANANAVVGTSAKETGQSYDEYRAQLKATNDASDALYYSQQKAAAQASQTVSANAQSASSYESLANAIRATISAIASFIAAAAQAAASGVASLFGGTSAAAGGHARDGGTFAVPGGTGVDTVPIMVSPGEVVTVQTPAQYQSGVAPAARPGQRLFATGGVTAGAGVTLGTGVALTSGGPAPVSSSVSGFSDDRSSAIGALTTATNSNVKTTTDNTTATSADTSATAASVDTTGANTSAIAANTGDLQTTAAAINTNTTAANTASNSLSANATANAVSLKANSDANTVVGDNVVKAANDNITAVNNNSTDLLANSAQLKATSTDFINAANAIVTSNNSVANTLATAVSNAANASSAVAGVASTATTQSATQSSNSNTTLTSSFNNVSAPGGSADLSSVSAKANQALVDQMNQTLNTLFGTQVIVDAYGRDASGTKVGDDSVAQLQQAAKKANDASTLNQQKPIGGTVYNNKAIIGQNARDGADFYVPGGSGVDSRLLNIAISPGESVHVRTPAQQSVNNNSSSSTQNVSFTINTPDADSFRGSQDQLVAKATRGLRRAARRG